MTANAINEIHVLPRLMFLCLHTKVHYSFPFFRTIEFFKDAVAFVFRSLRSRVPVCCLFDFCWASVSSRVCSIRIFKSHY